MSDVRRLYVVTSNAGKIRDFASGSDGRVLLEPLPGLHEIGAPVEDEVTFEGNAALKARFYSQFAQGKIVIADDSGIEVDALGGAPGVRSARYADDVGFAGPEGAGGDERNNLCLMEAMQGKTERGGRYRCALVAAQDGVVLWKASGSLEGSVLEEPRGMGGFGYDPFFYVTETGKTMAEMGPEERLAVSHRGKALAALLRAMLV